eukprot:CAMPEP_0185584080 /NCGR_PEP_ID=MMETSP0434-20130131/30000_1 /TAXON_ID=626734 ORGANISM="Favella taraikaensis, Strain Fe Narragansett Bay" /NCGR_SAMPLE_ID=MMETSP0434 /ASSEMBLY_ACC=CAM_ASM_000379 /LENGTH=32 /DNA_ID= /DNA_START= /DNA_END= /DNA_ORIENTATION=
MTWDWVAIPAEITPLLLTVQSQVSKIAVLQRA